MKATVKCGALAAAMAISASSASAQSNVTLYGLLDLWAGTVRTTPATGASTSLKALQSGGLTTSYWGLRGSEDLGAGLQAIFALEGFLRVDTGEPGRSGTDPYWARNAYVGIQGPTLGTITLGRAGNALTSALFGTNAFLDSTTFGSAFVGAWAGTIQGDTAFSNSFSYSSPQWGGLQVRANYSLGQERAASPDKNRDKALDLGVTYNDGPLLATLTGRRINLSSGEDGHEQHTLLAGVAYDFKVVRVFGQVVQVDERFRNSANKVDRSHWTAGVRVPAGVGIFMASMTSGRIDDFNAATPAKRKTFALGYDHMLSKRTDLYAAVNRDELKEPTGTKVTRAGLGIRHRF